MVALDELSALQILCGRLIDSLATVEQLKGDIAEQINEQTKQAGGTLKRLEHAESVSDLDALTFREWLKGNVLAQGKTITDFANETGLSRQLCSASLNKFDPSVANLVLSCEIIAEWSARPLIDVIIDAIQTTKAYKHSNDRMTKGKR